MLPTKSICYKFSEIQYSTGILQGCIDATYVIHLEGNGRYKNIIDQLEMYNPSKIVYIVFNKGYTNCEKLKNIATPAQDLIDAFLQIFKHSNSKNYNNILILEDDFIFNEQIKQKTHIKSICDFVNARENEDFQYMLGCIPYIKMPCSINLNHYINKCSTGTHACIYSKLNREKMLNEKFENITDWDLYSSLYNKRYMYYFPLCYQLFPETENSKKWGEHNLFWFYFSKITLFVFRLLKLDTQVEPGYSFFYKFSNIFPCLLLILGLYLLYKLSIKIM